MLRILIDYSTSWRVFLRKLKRANFYHLVNARQGKSPAKLLRRPPPHWLELLVCSRFRKEKIAA